MKLHFEERQCARTQLEIQTHYEYNDERSSLSEHHAY